MRKNKTTMTLATRRELTAVTVAARGRYQAISARIDLHRRGLLASSVRRAAAGDVTVQPQYWHKLPAKARPAAQRYHAARPELAVSHAAPVVVAVADEHVTTVVPEGELFRARCSCSWTSTRPMGKGYAKGVATRHRRTATVPTVKGAAA